MRAFSVASVILNPADETRTATVPKLFVEANALYTWVAGRKLTRLGIRREKTVEFQMANGQTITRSIGFAIIRVGEFFTIDEVVFAEPGDLQLLGSRTLEGMNVSPDPGHKKLVAAGPIVAA